MGNKWSLISKHIKGRSDNSIKNHWNANMKKKEQGFKEKLETILGYSEQDCLNFEGLEGQLIRKIKSQMANDLDKKIVQENVLKVIDEITNI